MAEATKEVRTTMYSYGVDGGVIVHRLPFDANNKHGMAKLAKFQQRGFTFNDPRVEGGSQMPQVLVTKQVNLNKPDLVADWCPQCQRDGREVLRENCNFHKEVE